jgi:GNAT superfamily N-acetyltransferase
MRVVVRPAEAGEERRLLGTYEWLFAPPGSRPRKWDPERAAAVLAEAIASPEAEILVAEAPSGELVGICTAYHELNSVRFGDRVWVEDLAVHPERRSQGIGKRLLDAAKDWARGRGATHLELASALGRTEAHRFYEREGPIGRAYSYVFEL